MFRLLQGGAQIAVYVTITVPYNLPEDEPLTFSPAKESVRAELAGSQP